MRSPWAFLVATALVACERHHTVKIVIPAGQDGWFEVVEMPGACAPVGINGPYAVIVVGANHVGCMGEHWTPRGFTKFVYIDSNGGVLAPDRVHGQTALSHYRTKREEKYSFLFCVGDQAQCSKQRPYEPSGAYGWRPRRD